MDLLFIHGKKKGIFDFFSQKEYGSKIIVTDIRPGFVDTAIAKGDGLFGYRKEKSGLCHKKMEFNRYFIKNTSLMRKYITVSI